MRPAVASARRTLLSIAALALACTGCFGPGTYPVAPETGDGVIGPGVWRTLGRSGPGRCTAVQPFDPDHPRPAFLWNDFPGPSIVVVRGDEAGFETEGCLPWFQVPGPFSVPLATPGQPFGQGDYFVGWEVEPGTYRAHTLMPMSEDGWPPPCSWARMSIDADLHVRLIAFGHADVEGTATTTIEPSDSFIRSSNCDQWVRVT